MGIPGDTYWGIKNNYDYDRPQRLMICPYCGKDRDSREAIDKISLLCKEVGGLKEEIVNPGGRLLIFSFGEKQLSDQCCWCDYENLKHFLYDRNKL